MASIVLESPGHVIWRACHVILLALFKFLMCKMKQEISHIKVSTSAYYPYHGQKQ